MVPPELTAAPARGKHTPAQLDYATTFIRGVRLPDGRRIAWGAHSPCTPIFWAEKIQRLRPQLSLRMYVGCGIRMYMGRRNVTVSLDDAFVDAVNRRRGDVPFSRWLEGEVEAAVPVGKAVAAGKPLAFGTKRPAVQKRAKR